MHSCNACGYCVKVKDHKYYCNDLDCEIDPTEGPVCSEENYNS